MAHIDPRIHILGRDTKYELQFYTAVLEKQTGPKNTFQHTQWSFTGLILV